MEFFVRLFSVKNEDSCCAIEIKEVKPAQDACCPETARPKDERAETHDQQSECC